MTNKEYQKDFIHFKSKYWNSLGIFTDESKSRTISSKQMSSKKFNIRHTFYSEMSSGTENHCPHGRGVPVHTSEIY